VFHISYGNGAVDVQCETNIAIAVQKSIEKLQQPLSNVVKITHQNRTWVGSELEIILLGLTQRSKVVDSADK